MRSEFSLPDGSMGENVIIFGVSRSSSVHIDNKKKDILILGKGPTHGLYDTKITAEAQYLINFSRLLEKYNENMEKFKISIKEQFDSEPVYNEKYLKAKIKSYNGKINTNFHNNKIPREGSQF